jgi:hypothetical protein
MLMLIVPKEEINMKHYVLNRIKEVLTEVYGTQYYLGSELRPSPRILNTRKHNVLETGSVSVHR